MCRKKMSREKTCAVKRNCREKTRAVKKLDSCMNGTFPRYVPSPTCATPYLQHTLSAAHPICATPCNAPRPLCAMPYIWLMTNDWTNDWSNSVCKKDEKVNLKAKKKIRKKNKKKIKKKKIRPGPTWSGPTRPNLKPDISVSQKISPRDYVQKNLKTSRPETMSRKIWKYLAQRLCPEKSQNISSRDYLQKNLTLSFWEPS